MVDITRPEYGSVWASEGEKLSPTQDKIKLGWVQEMMPFQWENFLQSRQDEAITYLLQKGIPEYSATQEYIAQKSVVLYQGAVYLATQTVTNVLPSVAASWKRVSTISDASGVVSVAGGGTGATTAAQARTNLGLGTASTLNTDVVVQKDENGNFSAGVITASLSGNASSADRWKTARTINIIGAATSDTKSIDGTSNTTLTVSELDATKLVGTASVNTTGNAATATKWASTKVVSLTGGASGTSNESDGSSNFEVNVTSLNASSLSSGTVPVSVLTNAVIKTSQTGSAILPSGTTAQRDISAQEAYFRYNSTTKLPEFYDNVGWKSVTGLNSGSFATSTDLGVANAKIAALESRNNPEIAFIYPNGGTAEAPANVVNNWRGVFDNPWPGHHVTATAFIFNNNGWATAGWDGDAGQGTAGYGVRAGYHATTDKVIVQTGATGVDLASNMIGSALGNTSITSVSSAPCYIMVEKKGKRNV